MAFSFELVFRDDDLLGGEAMAIRTFSASPIAMHWGLACFLYDSPHAALWAVHALTHQYARPTQSHNATPNTAVFACESFFSGG